MSNYPNWTCTTCGRLATLTNVDMDAQSSYLATAIWREQDEAFRVTSVLKRCPNPVCKAHDLVVIAQAGKRDLTMSVLWTTKEAAAGIGVF